MKIYIKSMVSLRCIMMVKSELSKLGILYDTVTIGQAELKGEITGLQLRELNTNLRQSGLEVLTSKKSILVERIKNIVIEMVHIGNEVPNAKYSNFISLKLNHNYTYLANLFSAFTGFTLQQFIIKHKVEKVKALLMDDELNITEISYKMHYSSVAHLSKQFRKITGITPSAFKESHVSPRQLESI